ncbi:unnamed protein product [Trichobilharzia regenti]|nr:unnamed protein product [Trichobilharzia regenti]
MDVNVLNFVVVHALKEIKKIMKDVLEILFQSVLRH